jgi:TonB-dependent receptor
MRLQAWKSYVLPSAFQLGGGAQVNSSNGGAGQGGTTTITQGNPNLKAIDALNIDTSFIWSRPSGELELSLFHKSLSNYIYSTVRGYTGATGEANGRTIIITPQNGGKASVYGAEMGLHLPLRNISQALNGFKIDANLTLQTSKVDTKQPLLRPDERLLNQPSTLANVQLAYGNEFLLLALSYRYTSDFVSQYGTLRGNSEFNTWIGSNRQLDFVMAWRPMSNIELSLQASNILASDYYRAGIGRGASAIPSIVDAGRRLSIQLNARY